jgi:hypothetical protein
MVAFMEAKPSVVDDDGVYFQCLATESSTRQGVPAIAREAREGAFSLASASVL